METRENKSEERIRKRKKLGEKIELNEGRGKEPRDRWGNEKHAQERREGDEM